MGRQIIKQPDGNGYALWSTVVDSFLIIDAQPEEIADYISDGDRNYTRERTARIVAQMEAGEQPYGRHTMTWDEALVLHQEVNGKPFDIEQERAASAAYPD